jgi:hypothetical protein
VLDARLIHAVHAAGGGAVFQTSATEALRLARDRPSR